MDINYDKGQATKVDLQFVAFNRNRYVRLYYMDTADNLSTLLGARSPI